MKETLDKLLTLSLELMETDKVRGDALWEIHKALEDRSDTNVSPPPTTQDHEASEENQVTARGEGIVFTGNIQTVNIYIREG